MKRVLKNALFFMFDNIWAIDYNGGVDSYKCFQWHKYNEWRWFGMITDKQKEAVWVLYETEHLSKKNIALKLGISRTKVIEILKEEKYRNEQLLNTINEMNKENNMKLLDMLREDKRIPSIASKILTLFNDDAQLAKEIERNGLRPLATVIGVISDKVIKASELSARLDTPDAFNQSVTIVNDADEVAKIKQERKKLMASEATIN